MTLDPTPTVFFAYASDDELVADTMRHAAKVLRDIGVAASTWEDLGTSGTQIIGEVCAAIDNADALVAEVGSNNHNVLFEAGYALSKGKQLLLCVDDSDQRAMRSWRALKLVRSLGRIDYSGNAEKLATRVQEAVVSRPEGVLIDELLQGAKPKQMNSIFAPASPVPTTQLNELQKTLERATEWRKHSTSDDLVLAPLHFYVQEIYRSTAAIVSLLAPHRDRATEHNARASLLAGVAHGMDIPLLLVAENGFQAPFDYQDLLFTFSRSVELQNKTAEWLSARYSVSTANGKRAGRLALNVELPLQSFGQYVAEMEREELADYFIPTTEFNKMYNGESKVFVGRKGTGKTATMQRLVDDLRGQKKNLVIAVKPANYELRGLLEVLERLGSGSSSEYMLLSLWSYLVYTEIAAQVVRVHNNRPAGWPSDPETDELAEELGRLGVDITDDLSVRLEKIVDDLLKTHDFVQGADKGEVARALRSDHVRQLRTKLSPALSQYARVAVLFDNLDKAWQKGTNYEAMAQFILSLLVASGKIERELRRDSQEEDPLRFTLSVFLRTDIYDSLSRFAREPDKISTLEVRWSDQELLLRVIEERFEALRLPDKSGVTANVWAEIFAPEVRGLGIKEYLTWRVISRPRDIVYFANSALSTAVNKRHQLVLESDFVSAESDYSEFAIEALLVEAQAEQFDLEEALFDFAGYDCTIDEDQALEVLARHGDPEEIFTWLIRSSFFGIEASRDHFDYVEGAQRAAMRLRVARNSSTQESRQLRVRIHPAFRPFLEVKDSDIHV